MRVGLNLAHCPVLYLWRGTGTPFHVREERLTREALSPDLSLLRNVSLLDLPSLLAAAPAVILEHKTDYLALVERADAGRFERGCMDEHVLASVLRLDEAEALSRIEKLYGTCGAHALAFPNRRGLAGQKGRTLGPAAQR